MPNSFGSRSTLKVGAREYEIHRLSVLEIVGAWVGSRSYGLNGMSVGICFGLGVESLVMLAAIRAALAVGPRSR